MKSETKLIHITDNGSITYEFDSSSMNVKEMMEEYRLFLLALSYHVDSISDIIGAPS